MKPDNPFADWLGTDLYGGTWVPVAGFGGWLGPAHVPVLFPAGDAQVMLRSTEWPLRLDEAGPEVFDLYPTARRSATPTCIPSITWMRRL